MVGQNSVFDAISNQYFQLTNAEKRVADYVLGHRNQVHRKSISELAEACGVADATVSRFCRRLGFAGYNAFKLELAEGGKEDGTGESLCPKMYQSAFDEAVAALRQTTVLLEQKQVKCAVELMQSASRVICVGQGSSMIMAEEAWSLFSTLSLKYFFVPDPHLQINTVAMMEPGDVLLFFSYSGSTRDFQDIVEVARSRKVKVILVTRFLNSPGGKLADVVLQCGANEIPLQAGSATARIAQLFVLEVLFRALYERNKEQAEQYREQIAESVTKKHL